MCPTILLSTPGIEQPVSETEGCMGIASDICKQVILRQSLKAHAKHSHYTGRTQG